jgi:hypothetical protein
MYEKWQEESIQEPRGFNTLELYNIKFDFNYRGYNLTCKEEIDIEKKLEKFNRALRIINQVFHPAKVRKHTRLSAYKTLAGPIITSGSTKMNQDSPQPK